MTSALTPLAADYDSFAWFYHRHWCAHYHPWAIKVLDRILMPRLAPGAAVLDLGCGVGTISKFLAERGCRVTGVDLSAEMIRYARQDVEGDFIVADMRRFRADAAFDAAISTFDTVNHILNPEELGWFFANVHRSLSPGCAFAFDVNLERAYGDYWHNTCAVVQPDHAFFIQGCYDAEQRLGRTEITMFRRNGHWRRTDSTLLQRCYPGDELTGLLIRAGFGQVKAFDVPRDLGIDGQPGIGRAFFLAVK